MIVGHLIGGPYDGAVLSKARRPNFVWVGGTASKPRGYTDPAANRQLYRSVDLDDEREQFLFAGYTHAKCSNCTGWVEIDPSGNCGFCGHAIRAGSAH